MEVAADKDHPPKSDSINACCNQWKNKYLKAQESRNALRQAVKFLECKINEIQAHNNKGCYREHIEIDTEISAEAQSSRCSEVKHLKSNPMVEKLRAKYTKQKYKLEASRYRILGHELCRLKICFVQLLHRFDVLGASFFPVSGSIQDQTKILQIEFFNGAHYFSYFGLSGWTEVFRHDNFGLVVTVLKSLIMSLEGESLSDVTASCLPSTNQLHTEFFTNVSCPFLEGDECIDAIANLLLEEIKNCWLQGIKQVDLLDSGLMPGNGNVGQWPNGEADQCATNKNNDVSSCLRKCLVSDTRPHALKNAILCRLSNVVSLVELVANKMSWHRTDIKLVPQLLNMLDTCAEEKIVIAIIVLLGQLGRIGIDRGGYEDRGVENLRCNLFAYLCRISSTKATLSIQIATVNILFALLIIGLETLFLTNISLSAYSKSISDNVKTLRKWFFGLGQEDQQILPSGLLKHTDVYNKSNLSVLSHLNRFPNPMIH